MIVRHHQHADHEHGFRLHDHDVLGDHLHHRDPDYVTYPVSETGTITYTGTPKQTLPKEPTCSSLPG